MLSPMFGPITRPNLSQGVLVALCAAWGVEPSDPNGNATPAEMEIGEAVFYHVLTTTYTPDYRDVNEEALTSNWARVPIPINRELLCESAALGRRIAALLRTDMEPDGVVQGVVPPVIRLIARPRRADDERGQIRDPDDLNVTINYRGAGRVESRTLSDNERSANHVVGEGVDVTNDVYWNPDAYWANVPPDVWKFQIGNFPVLRKWLEGRKRTSLERPLHLNELQQFSRIARRIAALLRMGPELDACHDRVIATQLYQPEDMSTSN